MNRLMDALAYILLTSGLALLVVSGWAFFTAPDEPGAVIEQPERDFQDLVAGQSYQVEFVLRNPTRHAVRIIGMPEC
ncbi:MAG: hypothetical protein C4297_07760 [Gemmataceae bacterium]